MLSQRFNTFNCFHLHLLCSNDESATSFNKTRSSIIDTVETDISFFGTSLVLPFKVIYNIKNDVILGFDFIEKNVESINVKQRKLALGCGTVVFCCQRDLFSLDDSSLRDFGSLVVGTLRVKTRRPPFTRRSRQLPPSCRDP